MRAVPVRLEAAAQLLKIMMMMMMMMDKEGAADKKTNSAPGEGKLWFHTGAGGARLVSSDKSTYETELVSLVGQSV